MLIVILVFVVLIFLTLCNISNNLIKIGNFQTKQLQNIEDNTRDAARRLA